MSLTLSDFTLNMDAFSSLNYYKIAARAARRMESPDCSINGRTYLQLTTRLSSFLAKAPLERLQKHLLHPAKTKLYEFLSSPGIGDVKDGTIKFLQYNEDACIVCKVYGEKPISFNILENGEERIYMWLVLDISIVIEERTISNPFFTLQDADSKSRQQHILDFRNLL